MLRWRRFRQGAHQVKRTSALFSEGLQVGKALFELPADRGEAKSTGPVRFGTRPELAYAIDAATARSEPAMTSSATCCRVAIAE